MRFIKQSQADDNTPRVPGGKRRVVDVSDFGRRPYGGSISSESIQRELSRPEIDHRHRSVIEKEEREKRKEREKEKKKQDTIKKANDRIKYIKDMDIEYDFMISYAIRDGAFDALKDLGVTFFDKEDEGGGKDHLAKIYNDKAISEYIDIATISAEAANIRNDIISELYNIIRNGEPAYIKTDDDVKKLAYEEGRRMGEMAVNMATSDSPGDIDYLEGNSNQMRSNASIRMKTILKIARIAFRK